jgi:hypothetical protein
VSYAALLHWVWPSWLLLASHSKDKSRNKIRRDCGLIISCLKCVALLHWQCKTILHVHPIKSCHVHICGHIFWKLLIKVAGCMCKNIYTVNVKIVTYKCFIGKELVLCVYSLVYTQNPPYFQCLIQICTWHIGQRPLFYHFFSQFPSLTKKTQFSLLPLSRKFGYHPPNPNLIKISLLLWNHHENC